MWVVREEVGWIGLAFRMEIREEMEREDGWRPVKELYRS
jgi:hypothetical protein